MARVVARPWLLGGLGAVAAGEALRNGLVGAPLPLLAGVVSLVAYPVAVAGLLALLRSRVSRCDTDLFVGAGLAATATGMLSWLAVTAFGGVHGDAISAAAAVVLPALDVACLTIAVHLITLPGERPATDRFLLAGVTLLLTSHTVNVGVVAGALGPNPAGGLLAAIAVGLWAAAVLHPSWLAQVDTVRVDPGHVGWTHLPLIGAALVGMPAMLAVQTRVRAHDAPLVVGFSVCVLLTIAYIADLLRERAASAYSTHHDSLTDLPNRALFEDRLIRALAHARRVDGTVAVMFLDLDHFKNVNDSVGHSTGDALLREVAARLVSTLRDEDTVARLSGDEFAILLPHVTNFEGVVTTAKRLLEAFTEPLALGPQRLVVSPSIGIAVYPTDGDDAETLLERADTAMYRAKDKGRRTFEIYTAAMQGRAQQRLSLEASLLRAIDGDELVLEYQPKVSLRSGQVVGTEALVRWEHPEHGLLYPDSFIELAEETGIIVPLGERVLELACAQNQAWTDEGLPPMTVAVNLSGFQLQRQGVAEMVSSVLRRTRLDPELLELELTESVALSDPQAMAATLQDLHEMGVRSSIDDFGTGYSSLSYLTRLPVSSLKIDKCFVQQLPAAGADASIVMAVIAMAHSLGLEVVAEGVETNEQLAFLWAHDCDLVQGYLFSKPLRPAALATFARDLVAGGPGRLPSRRAGGREPERELEPLHVVFS
jgi:diguanylate cyclase (GGDEF)-like protein